MSNPAVVIEPPLHATMPELERLYTTCGAISTEAFTVDDINKLIQTKVVKLSAAIKDAFRFATTWDYSQPEALNDKAVYRLLRDTPYTDIEDITVYKPVGFKGNLNQYVNDLQQTTLPALLGLLEGVVKAGQRHFGYYLSDLENLAEHRVTQAGNKDYSAARLQQLLSDEAKWVVAGNRSSEANYGELYYNNGECYQTLTLVNELNTQRWRLANPKVVSKETDALTVVVASLLEAIKQQDVKTSKPVLAALATEIELNARWVEWFSIMTTRMIDLTTALKLTEKKLLRAL